MHRIYDGVVWYSHHLELKISFAWGLIQHHWRHYFFMGFEYLFFINFSRRSRFSSFWESKCM